MSTQIHHLELLDKLQAPSHLIVPPLNWNRIHIGSALHLVSVLRKLGKKAHVLGHKEWLPNFPSNWDLDLFILNQDQHFQIEERPDWVWLWGVDHQKNHSQELKNFLIGCRSIQVLDWTGEKYRKWGDYLHQTEYLGGLPEFSFNLTKDLQPEINSIEDYLSYSIDSFISRYPMISQDLPIIHLLQQLPLFYDKELDEIPQPDHTLSHGLWTIFTFLDLPEVKKEKLLHTYMQHYLPDVSEHALFAFQHSPEEMVFRVISTDPSFELKVRNILRQKLKQNFNGTFQIQNVEEILDDLPQGEEELINNLSPWPKSLYTGTHYSFICEDPQWEIEREKRLDALQEIEDEEENEDEQEKAEDDELENIDWDSSSLLLRVQSLKPIAIKLSKLDLKDAHLPVIRLNNTLTKEHHLKLESEYIKNLEKAEAERLEIERIEKEKAEAERLEIERIEKEKAEAERLEIERIEKEKAEAERLEIERIEKEKAEAERLEIERIEKEKAEAERLEIERIEKEKAEAEKTNEQHGIQDYLNQQEEGWGIEKKDEELIEELENLSSDKNEYHYEVQEEKDFETKSSEGIEFPTYEEFLEATQSSAEEMIELEKQSNLETNLAPKEILNELEPEHESETETSLAAESIIDQLKEEEVLEELDQKKEEVFSSTTTDTNSHPAETIIEELSEHQNIDVDHDIKKDLADSINEEEMNETSETAIPILTDTPSNETVGLAEEVLEKLDQKNEEISSSIPTETNNHSAEAIIEELSEHQNIDVDHDIKKDLVNPKVSEKEHDDSYKENITPTQKYKTPYLWDGRQVVHDLLHQLKSPLRIKKSIWIYIFGFLLLSLWAFIHRIYFI